jgi:hypothetical protein
LRLVLKFSFKPPDGIPFVLKCLEILPVIMETYSGGEGGRTISWPPQSPDLTPLDFSVWVYVKDKAYVPPLPASLEELWARTAEAVATMDVDMIHRIWEEISYR